ncbi:uncharacterized protein PHACADRAFT_103503 [Phanerochaete carnosa HHB-10118-sp]|uniref:Carbohydrate kinase PfkB domain-containing protein n=1 Tax=Phanerochaete carnosa (strain HHB-10118-sp) TaxID=650164 RepID=K5VJD2_PHACS|nr:uncharacterized protein PHACADRAFT_103503 [Phanerochaete carnosa HHB-10118-sp]EKM51433.1 hypothetical protein PHACADRAFT_103503 [Phanerochaete carnosa HHB-10118-sp]
MSNAQREPLCLVRGSISKPQVIFLGCSESHWISHRYRRVFPWYAAVWPFHAGLTCVTTVPTVVRPGETLSSTHFERRAGGKGANQASAVAKAGGRVKLIGAVGEDGAHLVRGLEATGVDISDVIVDNSEPTGRAIIQLTPEGENCANYLLAPPLLSSPPTSADSSYTHLLLQNEIPWSATLAYLEHATKINATAVWNPSPLPSAEQLRAIPWGSLSWLIVNEGEVCGMLDVLGVGGDALQGSGQKTSQHATQLLEKLHAHPRFSQSVNVICTLGAQGLVALLSPSGTKKADSDVLHVPAAKLSGPVKDTTGAGDCFAGYFVAGLMEESAGSGPSGVVGVLRALRLAVKAAGLCVQRPGAVESTPVRSEVERSLGLQ